MKSNKVDDIKNKKEDNDMEAVLMIEVIIVD